jgi:hypothetical protein
MIYSLKESQYSDAPFIQLSENIYFLLGFRLIFFALQRVEHKAVVWGILYP